MSNKVALITGVTGPGRRLSGRAPARQGLCRPRREAPVVVVQHRARRPSLCRSARGIGAVLPALRRHDRRHQPDPPDPGDPADRDLQSRGPEPRPGELRNAGIHRQCRRARHAAPARGDPHPAVSSSDALLPGLDLGAVRQGPGDAAARDDAVLPAQPLCRRQALRLLDHGELSRGLWHARLERHPVQSREPDPRRDLRHAQDDPRRRGDRARPAEEALSRQSRREARLGPCARLCRGHVADAAAGRSPTITCSRPARRTPCASSSSAPSPSSGARSNGAAKASTRRGSMRRAARSLVRDRPALFPPDRGRSPARRSAQGAQRSSAGSTRRASRSWSSEMVRGRSEAAHVREPAL